MVELSVLAGEVDSLQLGLLECVNHQWQRRNRDEGCEGGAEASDSKRRPGWPLQHEQNTDEHDEWDREDIDP
jgi:hypothetical protein